MLPDDIPGQFTKTFIEVDGTIVVAIAHNCTGKVKSPRCIATKYSSTGRWRN
jgi:hypothetical protein